MITRFIGRSAALLLLGTGVGLTFVIAILMILIQLIGAETVVDHVSCRLGLNEDCMIRELDRKDQELEQRRRELLDLQRRSAELEALYERLAALDHAASSYVIFYYDKAEPKTVVSGHQYASLIDPDTLTGGWCYIALESGVLGKNLSLAAFEDDLQIVIRKISARQLSEADLSARDVERARARCRWPDEVSQGTAPAIRPGPARARRTDPLSSQRASPPAGLFFH